MKILVYDDLGSSSTSVKHIVTMLESLLDKTYSIVTVDRKLFGSDGWQTDCAMLVMPGGRDLPYCQALDGQPNQAIKTFVENGGRYLGICAGAYYASQSIEFEKGNSQMEIVASRQLGFYPGLCRGTAYPGFSYASESGARLVPVSVRKEHFQNNECTTPDDAWMYYNGGGYFVDPDQHSGVTVLSDYKELDHAAAIVHCRVGQGHALLLGTHPEYEASSDDLLVAATTDKHHLQLLNQLALSRADRNNLMRSCLSRIDLGLMALEDGSESNTKIFEPTTMYLTGLTKSCISEAVSRIQRQRNPVTYLMHDATDSFCVSELDDPINKQTELFSICREREGRAAVVQLIYPTLIAGVEPLYPSHSDTPCFDSAAYYQLLVQKRQKEQTGRQQYIFGSSLIYTSHASKTFNIFTKNPKFLESLSSGLVCISLNKKQSRDLLYFNIVLHHILELRNAPVVFLKYLVSLSIAKSIQSIDKDLSVHIKWPSDIYLKTKTNLIKIGQSKIHVSFVNNQFVLVIDNQINKTDIMDAVSTNDGIDTMVSSENILTSIITTFESLYIRFCQNGIEDHVLQEYYDYWLHKNTIVTLKTKCQSDTVRIIGITPDHGMLKVESLHHQGKLYGLLPDNHFLDLEQSLIRAT
ncbi:biotin-protein ligase [Blakeslea trispora]|nr:biotin-protein ligase [Blakeslea trispora]